VRLLHFEDARGERDFPAIALIAPSDDVIRAGHFADLDDGRAADAEGGWQSKLVERGQPLLASNRVPFGRPPTCRESFGCAFADPIESGGVEIGSSRIRTRGRARGTIFKRQNQYGLSPGAYRRSDSWGKQ